MMAPDWLQDGPRLAPRWGQDDPNKLQGGSKTRRKPSKTPGKGYIFLVPVCVGSNIAQEPPRWSTEANYAASWDGNGGQKGGPSKTGSAYRIASGEVEPRGGGVGGENREEKYIRPDRPSEGRRITCLLFLCAWVAHCPRTLQMVVSYKVWPQTSTIRFQNGSNWLPIGLKMALNRTKWPPRWPQGSRDGPLVASNWLTMIPNWSKMVPHSLKKPQNPQDGSRMALTRPAVGP